MCAVCSLTGDLRSSLVGRVVVCVVCSLTGDLRSSVVGSVVVCAVCSLTGDLRSSLVGRVVVCAVCSLTGDLRSSLVGRIVMCAVCSLTGDLRSCLVGRVVVCTCYVTGGSLSLSLSLLLSLSLCYSDIYLTEFVLRQKQSEKEAELKDKYGCYRDSNESFPDDPPSFIVPESLSGIDRVVVTGQLADMSKKENHALFYARFYRKRCTKLEQHCRQLKC